MNNEEKIDNQMLGEQLKKAREARGVTIEAMANQTRIHPKYLLALEKSEWEHLPSPVYTRGFLLKYSRLFNLDGSQIMKLYEEEFEKLNKAFSKKNVVPELKTPRFLITPKLLVIATTIGFLAVALGYFGWQIYGLWQPPQIILENPTSDYISNQQDQWLSGFASKSVLFKINGKAINLDRDGYFSEFLNLNEGLNVIELKAENRFGKEAVIIRKIIFNK